MNRTENQTTKARPLVLGEISCGSAPETAYCVDLPPGLRWYCWKSHPGAQFTAIRELAAQGFRAYLPRYVAGRADEAETIKPLFGPYGFVAFDRSANRWRAIHSTRGISALISVDHTRPIPVPAGIVEALQRRGRPGDGVIDDMYRRPSYGSLDGQPVKITAGPFADLHGLCRWSNQKRVAVLLEVMGRLVETQIQRRDVEAVS